MVYNRCLLFYHLTFCHRVFLNSLSLRAFPFFHKSIFLSALPRYHFFNYLFTVYRIISRKYNKILRKFIFFSQNRLKLREKKGKHNFNNSQLQSILFTKQKLCRTSYYRMLYRVRRVKIFA